jgi:hypothetical protein
VQVLDALAHDFVDRVAEAFGSRDLDKRVARERHLFIYFISYYSRGSVEDIEYPSFVLILFTTIT